MSDQRTANAVDRKIGQRVRVRRLEIGMSQERLAALLNITFQQVQKYEKGVNRIAASRLFHISAALDVPVARFFENLGVRSAGVAPSGDDFLDQALATREGAELAALFASIKNARVRRRVVELVRSSVSGESKRE